MKIAHFPIAMIIIGIAYGTGAALFWLERTDNDYEYYMSIILPICIAILYIWLLATLLGVMRHALWKMKGYAGMPINIYPFFIIFCGGPHVRVFFVPIVLSERITPPTYRTCDSKESYPGEIAYSVERCVLLMEGIVSMCLLIVFAITGNWVLAFSIIFAIAILVLISCVNDHIFHGHFAMLWYIKKHYVRHYIAISAILYQFEFEAAQKTLLSCLADDEEKFAMIDLLSCKRLLVMGLGQGKVLSPDLVWYIENRIIAPLTANRMFFTREGIEVVKLYMYYGIINADEAKVSIAVNKIIALRDCTLFGQPTPKGLEEYYNWMLDIGEYRRVYDFDMAGKKRSLQGKDYPYDKLPYYQLMGKAIERDLIGFCEYCIRGV